MGMGNHGHHGMGMGNRHNDEDDNEDDEDDEIGGASPLSDWSSAPSSPMGQPIGDREASEREIDGNLSDASSTGSFDGGAGISASQKSRGSKFGLLAFKVPEPAVPVLQIGRASCRERV